jgi:rRNA maturation protein Nop10
MMCNGSGTLKTTDKCPKCGLTIAAIPVPAGVLPRFMYHDHKSGAYKPLSDPD